MHTSETNQLTVGNKVTVKNRVSWRSVGSRRQRGLGMVGGRLGQGRSRTTDRSGQVSCFRMFPQLQSYGSGNY